MEHVRRAGIPFRNSIYYIGTDPSTRKKTKSTIARVHTPIPAQALHVISMINIQFIIVGEDMYMSSSYTWNFQPYSTVHQQGMGIPIVPLAARVILGHKKIKRAWFTQDFRKAEYFRNQDARHSPSLRRSEAQISASDLRWNPQVSAQYCKTLLTRLFENFFIGRNPSSSTNRWSCWKMRIRRTYSDHKTFRSSGDAVSLQQEFSTKRTGWKESGNTYQQTSNDKYRTWWTTVTCTRSMLFIDTPPQGVEHQKGVRDPSVILAPSDRCQCAYSLDSAEEALVHKSGARPEPPDSGRYRLSAIDKNLNFVK